MNKTQLIEGLAKLLAESDTKSPQNGAILTELTKIDNAVKQIKSLLTSGKKTRKHTRIGHKRRSKYQAQINNAAAYILKSGSAALKNMRVTMNWTPLEYCAVKSALENHPDVIVTRNEYGEVQYMSKVHA